MVPGYGGIGLYTRVAEEEGGNKWWTQKKKKRENRTRLEKNLEDSWRQATAQSIWLQQGPTWHEK